MNIDDVLKLVNAGYTREEIAQMQQAQGNDQGNDQRNDQRNDQGNDQELAQLRQELTQTQTQLKELVKQMQSNNLKTASVNIVPDADLEKKTDAALAELIRPTIKKED